MDFNKHIIRAIKGFMLSVVLSLITTLLLTKQGNVVITIQSVIMSFLAIAVMAYLLGWLVEFLSARLDIKWLDR